MFGRNNRPNRPAKQLWTPPQGLITQRQQLMKSVPFVYDPSGQPAFDASVVATKSVDDGKISLRKGFEAAKAALAGIEMAGLRMEIIVLVDDSYSMKGEFLKKLVQQMLVRFLGFGLNVDVQIQVIVYGRPHQVLTITADNYLQAPSMINPTFGGTPMTEAYRAAVEIAKGHDKLTMIVNLTDGNPNDRVTMSNAVIESSGWPIFLKNLAIKSVPYLEEIDDLPSYHEIKRHPDGTPVLDGEGNLVIEINKSGLRLLDHVDSQALDPYSASDAEFATALAEEIPTYLEVAGRVGLLTGVPGVTRTFF